MDRMTLQIFADYCAAAAEAMAHTLMHTAHSTFVKETEDFSCGLLTIEGATFASPKSLGATWFLGLDYGPVISQIASYEDGDICITNDPYSGSVATHTPDIHIWKPVFADGELVCFVAGHIHNTDVGGAVPATLSRTLTEIHQEGLRIPPTKLVERGVINQGLVDIIERNVRVPAQNWGDLKAQIASVGVGERRVKEIVARFGTDGFRQGVQSLLDYGTEQAKQIIRSIPNGEYFHAEYIDEDSDGGVPCRIALTLKIEDEQVILDFSGSDPQLHSSLNMPTGGQERHALVMIGLSYILYTLDNRLLLNSGILQVAKAVLPVGTVVHAVSPAAVGMRSLTCEMVQMATFGAFAKAIPDRVSARGASGCIVNVKTIGKKNRTVMASIGPVVGGSGGMPAGDGAEGAGGHNAYLRNTPIEINEAEVPILFSKYGLEPDTGGAGRWRGGSSMVMEFKVFAPGTVVTARNCNGAVMSPWGLGGGIAGSTSSFTRNPGATNEEQLGNRDIVECDPGDIIQIIGQGGGGWGDPFERDAELVALDVKRGLISVAIADGDYGVVVTNGAVDLAATQRRRADARKQPSQPNAFDYGPGRTAFESVWTEDRYQALTEVLSATAIPWRHWAKHAIFEAVERGDQEQLGVEAQIKSIYAGLKERFPQLSE
ncbi:hydantoinase B/oxoprolinase family protein [Mesorhizobium sp.]|uniref:hydantoinase B/oxoprolinase family protein n=1 Tax=Mesorhizobium sp. TaxID=1871066 RepID=UPI000FEA436C|nr:hydantoinase B/oxoprolinase family protein [Mesorhizobium sp.]RWA97310.1 MAG: hydantoinase B/oxoprolinase family protein [Mesorhizobium sp.]